MRLTCTLLSFWISCSAVYAGHHTDWGFMVHSDTPTTLAIFDLGPWFNSFDKTLRTTDGYVEFVVALTKHFGPGDNIACTFTIDKSKTISNLKISTSSGNPKLDQQLLSVVRGIRCSDLPNNLPTERGIQLEFWKRNVPNSPLFVWSQLDDSTFDKKFAIVDYIGPKGDHPWKEFNKNGRFRGGGATYETPAI